MPACVDGWFAMVVIVIKESHLKHFNIIEQDNRLALLKRLNSDQQNNIDWKYEIVCRITRFLSLSRTNDEEVVQTQFEHLKQIFDFTLTKDVPEFRAIRILTTLMECIEQHPEWKTIHMAAYCDIIQYFSKLKLQNHEINDQTIKEKCTPLHLAILKQSTKMVEIILTSNPNITLLDVDNCSLLHYAVKSSNEILEIILKVKDIRQLLSIKNKDGHNPIEVACFNKEIQNLKSLMYFGLTVRQLTVFNSNNNNNNVDKLDEVKITKFATYELNNLDLSYIERGGCPLHWSKTVSIIERLLNFGFAIDSFNLDGDTPLLMMVRLDRLKCVLALLYNGADVNKTNLNGDAPLHIAVMSSKIYLAMALIVFDADVNLENGNKQTSLHLAATSNQVAAQMVELFQKIGAKPCRSSMNCNAKCTEEKSDLFYNDDLSAQEMPNYGIHMKNLIESRIKQKRSLSEIKKSSSNVSRMICLDGGGVKGLIAIQVLIELQKHLKQHLRNYFDWIVGTSTGALISFYLAKNHSLKELRKIYFTFKDIVLTGSRPYSTNRLEEVLKNLLGADVALSDVFKDKKYLVLTTARVDFYPPILQLFRSYPINFGEIDSKEGNDQSQAWKALRASSAAPTFFQHFPPYSDGGLVSNNPTLDAIAEFYRYRKSFERYNLKNHKKISDLPELRLVLSIGTGQTKRIQCNQASKYNKMYNLMNLRSSVRWLVGWIAELANQLKSHVTNSNDHIVSRANYWCSSLNIPFFRLSPIVPKLSLNETDDWKIIQALWEVKLYSYRMEGELKKIAALLDEDG